MPSATSAQFLAQEFEPKLAPVNRRVNWAKKCAISGGFRMNGRMTLRSLRRTAAFLAINPGANVKAAEG